MARTGRLSVGNAGLKVVYHLDVADPLTPGALPPAADKTWLERLLAPVADVRRTETTSVLLMTATMLLLLGAYYMLKTAREVLVLTRGGAEVKTYASAGQAILLLGLVPAYAALASRVNRVRLVLWVTLFFAANLVLFALFGRHSSSIGVIYFLWIGIFNVMVIAQFWAFAADLFTPEQGKRLFPLIGLGSNLGAWVGSVQAGRLMRALGPFPIMLVAACVLVVCVAMIAVASRFQIVHSPHRAHEAVHPVGREGPFEMIRHDRYLILIALLTIVLNVVNTSGEYLFGRLVVEHSLTRFGTGPEFAAERERFVGAVYGSLFSYENLAGFLIQLFLVSRIFKWIGVANALFIQPTLALVAYLLAIRAPSIYLVGWFKVADNATDYSLGNTAKQALWLPTSRAAKYKAKQAIDSFFMRFGDVVQAFIVYTGQLLSFGVPAFAALNVVLTLVWLGVLRRLKPEYNARVDIATQQAPAKTV
jgi:ATP:ADP antiporter, AAA family